MEREFIAQEDKKKKNKWPQLSKSSKNQGGTLEGDSLALSIRVADDVFIQDSLSNGILFEVDTLTVKA